MSQRWCSADIVLIDSVLRVGEGSVRKGGLWGGRIWPVMLAFEGLEKLTITTG
jgi:hypothetical protein